MAATRRNKELRDEKEYLERITANRNRPENEVTISLIDAIHAICYQLKDRDFSQPGVTDAVKDLFENSEGFSKIMSAIVGDFRDKGGKIKL